MNSSKLKDYAEIFSIIIALLGTLGIGASNNLVLRIIVSVALGVFALVIIFNYVKRKKKEKLMSNVGLTKEANRVCKKINKLIKANIASLNKYSQFTKEKLDRDDINNFKLKFDNKPSKKTIDQIRNERLEISDYMINTVFDMDRILLLSEQYDYRIKFGKYIAEYSNNDMQIQKAYIDFLGWTYVIMGKNKLAEKYIKLGISCIENYLENTPLLSDKDKNDALMKRIRAYRHLGSNHNLYIKKPLECLTYLNEGLKLLNEETFKKYYLEKDNNKFVEMEVGLQYGVAICNLYLFKTKNKGLSNVESLSKYLKEASDLVVKYKDVAKGFANKHRYVKFLLLENSIHQEIKKLDDSLKASFPEIAFNENILAIEKSLNSSLYSDEGMIYYLEQKLDSICEKVNSILE